MCFANESNHKLIQHIYPVYQFKVNVDTFDVKKDKSFNFSLEKLENIIQLRICDVSNQSKMFLTSVGKFLTGMHIEFE